MIGAAWVAFVKEMVDALRDRRTLAIVLVSSVLLGPVLLIALSGLIASLEAGARARVVHVQNAAAAPGLVNFLQRQNLEVAPAPPDVEARLRAGSFDEAVLRVPDDFEAAMLRGERPRLELLLDSANRTAASGAGRLARVVQGYVQERATLELVLRGVSPELLQPVELVERDLASTASRGAQLTGMLPFFVMMAVLYGALGAALDTTAGERERGSLEPLLATSAPPLAIVIGKWGAVAMMGMGVAVLSSLSFLPAQSLLRSDTLRALFRFGPVEVAAFLSVLLPFAAALSAVLMAVAIRCRSFKEAQASTTVVVLAVSLTPLVTLFNPRADAPWQLWVPGLAQSFLMTRVLKGEAIGVAQVLLPLGVCVVLTVLGIAFVARSLRGAAVK
jgi:sodium transport system permease protein